MMTSEYAKPLPRLTVTNRPYWQAAKSREIRMQRCKGCRNLFYPIAPVCPHCLSEEYEWVTLSGKGKVVTWTIYRRSFDPSLDADIPYNVALVELDEGPRLFTNIVEVSPADIRFGMRVEAIFEDATNDVTLIKFRRA